MSGNRKIIIVEHCDILLLRRCHTMTQYHCQIVILRNQQITTLWDRDTSQLGFFSCVKLLMLQGGVGGWSVLLSGVLDLAQIRPWRAKIRLVRTQATLCFSERFLSDPDGKSKTEG